MTEQINDQISAFIDDELSPEESTLLVRRFERDPNARSQAVRYTMIGAALRGETIAQSSLLRGRIAAALDGAAPAAEVRATGWSARYGRSLVGVGIAAAVAVAAIGTLRIMNDAQVTPAGARAPAVAAQARTDVAAPSYVVPQDATPTGPVSSPIRLTNYLIHHSEYASGLGRASVSSNVVGATVEPMPEQQAGDTEQWR
jgi:negative regulator of sigma E activity